MGNSESHYSLQGPKGTSFLLPGKTKPCSLKFPSTKEEVLSPHGWWKGGPIGSSYKSRATGRGCLSQHKGSLPYVSRHYDCVAKGNRGVSALKPRPTSLQSSGENGYHYRGCGSKVPGGERNGHALNGPRTPDRMSRTPDGMSQTQPPAEDRSSPKVSIKKDGNLRVEFTNGNSLDQSAGPVQLLRFSPTLESTPSCPPDSQGSSLSSEGSWYDSPWGNGAELSDADNTCSSSGRTAEKQTAEEGAFGRRSSPVFLSDLYRNPAVAGTFPVAAEMLVPFPGVPRTHHRASLASVLDVAAEEECPGARQYSSYTLPCRTETTSKKDSLKSRIRHFSDWTGSLSRKKRKLQEPRSKEVSEGFDSGVDGLTADTSSPSQVSSLLWYPGAAQGPPVRSGSAGALHSSDALRQNIYQNFMRELETGHTGAGERRDPSTEAEETSSDSAGSLEQLDLLFEKEQGVVRKAGWLFFKPLITLHKDKKLELVPRRRWKQYWVMLKGCTLLFYETYGKSSTEQDLTPRYALFAEDSIVQSVPEHPKKENVFCLSNSYGDVYLFQATNQTDLENWVTAIHSASASLFAKKQGKEDTVRLLRSQTRGLLQKIDMDGKMKKMAELQLSIVSDPKNRKAIENQIQQWEQNLEKFNMDLFRVRCYLASLQGGELPNPKSLLAAASRPSKMALGRLGIFSVSSFHALVCSRDETTLRKRSLSLSQRIRNKRGLFSSLKGLDNLTKRGRDKRQSVSQVFESNGGGQQSHLPPSSSERLDGLANLYSVAPPEGSLWESGLEAQTYVYMPDNLAVTVPIRGDHTVMDVLSLACKVKQLDPSQHCLRLRSCAGGVMEVSTPTPSELIQELVYEALEVFSLNVYTMRMSRPTSVDFGFAVTGHVDGFRNSRIFVSEVLPDGLAFSEGLRPGDEILVLNGKSVATLDLGLMQTLFSEQTLNLTLRRDAPLDNTGSTWPDSEAKDPCPPAPLPNQSQLLEEFLDRHHGPHHASSDVSRVPDAPGGSVGPGLDSDPLRTAQHRKSVETVCSLYQTFQEGSGGLMESRREPAGPCPRHMSATERLRKVIQELVDTEKSYVKDLSALFEIYLKPLQNETFLTLDEMESLFGSLPEMLDFQRVFLQTLEERIASSPDFSTLETPVQFKKLLFSLGGSFLYYADHFKLYSGFCANHIKVQKVLERAKTDRAFKEFLDTKNPTKQHSSTLESYLIKPVQRVLKYPLLLRELVSLTDSDSEEHYHLTEALKAMEKVASHINEMQKIYEDYGTVFDQLVAEQSGTEKEVTEISMGEFLMHSSVVWLNPFPSLGRMRKDPELTVFVFKKAVILVYREGNKMKKKMTPARSAYSHGDLDPFKFRWLVPLSALQVRMGNAAGTETNCIWELIHTKSELEGRPETVFQLCSSVPECKANTIKVIRSVLRENVRRGEKGARERLVPLRSIVPNYARIGSSRASWLCKQPSLETSLVPPDALKGGNLDSDEGSLSSGCQPSEGPSEPRGPVLQKGPQDLRTSRSPNCSVKESDILSDEDEFCERARQESPTSAIEAQFQRLKMEEEASVEPAPCVQPEGAELNTPESKQRRRTHFSAIKRKGNSLRGTRVTLLHMREHSRSLDTAEGPTEGPTEGPGLDLNALLEREFSVQSLTSVVNEDCFYDMAPPPTLQHGGFIR